MDDVTVCTVPNPFFILSFAPVEVLEGLHRMSQIFVTTLAGKTSSYQRDTNRTTAGELLMRVADKEGLDKDALRLVAAGKDLTESKDKLLGDLGVRAGSTVQVVFRLVGGSQIDADTLWELLSSELDEGLAATPHQLHQCPIMGAECVEGGEVPCVKACCIWVCDACLLSMLKTNAFEFKCTICKKSSPVESVITHPSVVPVAASYRATAELLKKADVQICRCGARMVNETMYPKQKCYVCKRTFCFFCNNDWDNKKMKPNQKYGCCDTCSLKHKVSFELVEFQYGRPNDKIPNRRVCPKCSLLGGYDGKCKYHTCQCKYTFCFFCLRSEKDCRASGSSYGNLNCTEDNKPKVQSVECLPMLMNHSSTPPRPVRTAPSHTTPRSGAPMPNAEPAQSPSTASGSSCTVS